MFTNRRKIAVQRAYMMGSNFYTLDWLDLNWSEWKSLDASHKRQEIETALIGAYYLEVGEAPLAQFEHTENIPV